jgi:hypothetical protein
MLQKGSHKGLFHATHPDKYLGDAKNIVYRSSWELKLFRYCDLTPGVIKWASEEFHIPYLSPVDKRMHRYFPDVYMQVRTTDGSIKHSVIEIKPKVQTLPPKASRKRNRRFLSETMTYAVNQAKWEAATAYCKVKGWTFMVVNETHLGIPKHR